MTMLEKYQLYDFCACALIKLDIFQWHTVRVFDFNPGKHLAELVRQDNEDFQAMSELYLCYNGLLRPNSMFFTPHRSTCRR